MVCLRLAAALLLLLGGCADLQGVRTFAAEGARFAADTSLAERFQDTYDREAPYLDGLGAERARENDRARRAVAPDLLRVHRTLGAYLRVLAATAGAEVPTGTQDLGDLGAALTAHPELGLEPRHVQACTHLAQVAARWTVDGRQSQSVAALLREGDPPLQVLLEGQCALVAAYRQTHEDEARTVLGLLEVELALAQDPLVATLARAHLQAKRKEYALAGRRYAVAVRGLRALQEGHRDLVARRVRPDLGRLTQELQEVRTSLQAW